MDRFQILSIQRADGVYLRISDEILLDKDNDLLVNPEIESAEVDYTDTDGGEMIHQRHMMFVQPIRGILRPSKKDFWSLHSELSTFFVINQKYNIVYRRKDGVLFSREGGWLSDNIQIKMVADEGYALFSVGLKFGNSNRYQYTEDAGGQRAYANSVDLEVATAAAGGLAWDSIGMAWDSTGAIWEPSSGGIKDIHVASTKRIYPVWTVHGEAVNPSLQNNTTDTAATFNGTVSAGQTLVVDFETGMATLDGAVVSRNVTGQVRFETGLNSVGFTVDGGTVNKSTIQWNNIIG